MCAVHAPYNFVPLSPHVFKADWATEISHDRPFRDGYCGTIPFRVIALSPLCVGGDRQQDADGQTAGLTHVRMFVTPAGGKAYAIPGSSIRGMIRNVVEIATFSKFTLVDDQHYAVRDVSGSVPRYTRAVSATVPAEADGNTHIGFRPKVEAGWLSFDAKAGVWRIVPCSFARIEQDDLGLSDLERQRFRVRSTQNGVETFTETAEKYRLWSEMSRLPNGWFRLAKGGKGGWHDSDSGGWQKSLFYEKATIADEATPNAVEGSYVFTGQPSASKHREFVFYRERQHKAFEVPPEVIQGFLSAEQERERRRDNGKVQSAWTYLKARLGETGEPIPVFYIPDAQAGREIAAFGLSMMFPLVSPHSVGSLARRRQSGADGKWDWAEAIFGRVTDAGTDNIKGRVSFSLCTLAAGQAVEIVQSGPGILSSPKASFYPAYLEQSATAGGLVTEGNPKSYLDDEPNLRGWKRYPVRRNGAGAQVPEENLRGKFKLQSQFELVRDTTVFEGVLRFHNLRERELGALLWAMTFGNDPCHAHALGGGKPWGYGQVRIEIDVEKWSASVIPNVLGAQPPPPEAFVEAFTCAMEESARQAGVAPWAGSAQLQALLAMADPEKAPDGNGPAGRLASMRLEQFGAAKRHNPGKAQYASVLRPYT